MAYFRYPAKINKLILKINRDHGVSYTDIGTKISAMGLLVLIRRLKSQEEAAWHKTFEHFYKRVNKKCIKTGVLKWLLNFGFWTMQLYHKDFSN